MKKELEQNFINRFIVKEKRERLYYELSGKKRMNGISRFCHNADNLILPSTIIRSGSDLSSDEISSLCRKYTDHRQAYIIAFHEDLDQVSCDLSSALDQVLGNGMAAVILLDNVAVIETEQCQGTPYRYLLYRTEEDHG